MEAAHDLKRAFQQAQRHLRRAAQRAKTTQRPGSRINMAARHNVVVAARVASPGSVEVASVTQFAPIRQSPTPTSTYSPRR